MFVNAALATLTPPTLTIDETAFRQLRHQTKNALQRILCQIAQCRELQATPHGQRLVSDLERRVRLSSAVSDALFGITSTPGPLQQRLDHLCAAVMELMGDADATIRLEVAVEDPIPAALDSVILRIAHEFLGNALRHGMYARAIGAITVRVARTTGRTVRLQVLDDGWGFQAAPEPGEGLRLATLLAQAHRGTVGVLRRNGLTVAEATLNPA